MCSCSIWIWCMYDILSCVAFMLAVKQYHQNSDGHIKCLQAASTSQNSSDWSLLIYHKVGFSSTFLSENGAQNVPCLRHYIIILYYSLLCAAVNTYVPIFVTVKIFKACADFWAWYLTIFLSKTYNFRFQIYCSCKPSWNHV
jgi:hypothetical protein